MGPEFAFFVQELRGLHLSFPSYPVVTAETDSKPAAVKGDRRLHPQPKCLHVAGNKQTILFSGDFLLSHSGCPSCSSTAQTARETQGRHLSTAPRMPAQCSAHTAVFQHKCSSTSECGLRGKFCRGNGAALGSPSFIFAMAGNLA